MGGNNPRDGKRSWGSPMATSVMEIHISTIKSMYSRNLVTGTRKNRLFTVDLVFPCYKIESWTHEGIKKNSSPEGKCTASTRPTCPKKIISHYC
jgi:hypothetical protein